jgi:hypothetical protein
MLWHESNCTSLKILAVVMIVLYKRYSASCWISFLIKNEAIRSHPFIKITLTSKKFINLLLRLESVESFPIPDMHPLSKSAIISFVYSAETKECFF